MKAELLSSVVPKGPCQPWVLSPYLEPNCLGFPEHAGWICGKTWSIRVS